MRNDHLEELAKEQQELDKRRREEQTYLEVRSAAVAKLEQELQEIRAAKAGRRDTTGKCGPTEAVAKTLPSIDFSQGEAKQAFDALVAL